MYSTYPVIRLDAKEANAAPFYTMADYQKDCILGRKGGFGYTFYEALEKAVKDVETPTPSNTDKAADTARQINFYLDNLRERIGEALQDYLAAHDGVVDRWPDPDTGYELTLRSDDSYEYLEGIFQFHFFAGEYSGKGSVSLKFKRPSKLCLPHYVKLHTTDRNNMPEYQDYVHKWCALQEQVEKASIFSKGKRKKELEAFEEESKALKEANWDYKRNYYSLCEAWSQAWFDYCVAKGLEVKDPDVKERRKQEFAEKEKQQK